MKSTFAGKKIVVGVSGSISAFKVVGWVSTLVQEEALVEVIMTAASQEFVAPLSFESLTGRPVHATMFGGVTEPMAHINLGRECDCILVAPASAQTIGRLANGLADDLLAATVLAATVPVIVCPAMNSRMYQHPATQANLNKLHDYGYTVIDPDSGSMACGDQGVGRLVEWERARERILRSICVQDLAGQRILVTAGPTHETYDPARFITNRSSGKMGYAIARTAYRRGADVTLISGPTALSVPEGVETIPISSAADMYEAVMGMADRFSIIVKAAAVSDFRPAEMHQHKIKKQEGPPVIELLQTQDILRELGKKRNPAKQLLIGFAAESTDHHLHGKKKREEKALDLIVVNDIASSHTGFGSDNNQLSVISEEGEVRFPLASKMQCADFLWDHVIENNLLKS